MYYDAAARHVHDVAVDKSNNYIYASVGDAMGPWYIKYIIRSTNGGSNWSQILSGMPQIVAIQAVPGARLFATDEGGNGQIYRSTNDASYTLAFDTGAHCYGFWFSTNPLNGRVYASFVYGERNGGNPADNLAGIYTSDDNGLNWGVYRNFAVTTSYTGSIAGSNFVNGIMYYSVLLDSGWQNGAKIYRSYTLSDSASDNSDGTSSLNMPSQTIQNDSDPSPTSLNIQPNADQNQSSATTTSWLPLSVGAVATQAIYPLYCIKDRRKTLHVICRTHGYRIQGSNNFTRANSSGGEKI